MDDNLAKIEELERRIEDARANIRELTDLAAATNGAASEERIAERLAQAEVELADLTALRDRAAAEQRAAGRERA